MYKIIDRSPYEIKDNKNQDFCFIVCTNFEDLPNESECIQLGIAFGSIAIDLTLNVKIHFHPTRKFFTV